MSVMHEVADRRVVAVLVVEYVGRGMLFPAGGWGSSETSVSVPVLGVVDCRCRLSVGSRRLESYTSIERWMISR